MPSLTRCFEDVQARLTTLLESLGEKIPNMGLGENAKFHREAPPRIVWVPTSGTIRRPRQAGGDGVSNPRQLWLRELHVEARIWHEDIQHAEDLANHLAAVMAESATGPYALLGEAWDTLGELQKGVQYVLTFSIQLPFTDEPSATTQTTSASLTTQFASG